MRKPNQEFSAHRAKRDARIRTAPSPDPSGLSWWTLRRLHAPVPRVHLFVSLAGPTPSDGAGTSRLHKGPLATLPGTSRVRLPPASPPCCDRTAVQVSHLHSIDQRLTAHTHVVHPRGSRLLRYLAQDRCLARLGPGARRNARFAAARPFAGVALFRLADRRAPWRGVAQEGRARLAVAVPTSPSYWFWIREEC